MGKVEKLPALQGLRVLATAGIFLFHSGFLLQGTFPVTLFFMLSGFMMYYTKRDTITPLTGIKKIKKMYPLHLITIIIAIFVGNTVKNYSLSFAIKSGLLHVLLLQAWFPKYTLTYNGLSWYLSVTFFLYMISYPFVKIIKKMTKPKLALAFVLALTIVLNCIDFYIGEAVLYMNPLYRTADFLTGMLIAKIFMEQENSISISSNFTEIVLVVWFVVQYGISLIIKGTVEPGYFSILFTVAIYVFAIGKGIISKILSKPIFDKIAAYTFDFYMIHELALIIFRKFFADLEIFYPVKLIIISIPALLVSVLFIVIYRMILKKLKMYRENNFCSKN